MAKVENLSDNQQTLKNKNLDALKEILPNCFDKNGEFIRENFDEILNTNGVNFSKESYTLNWLGKSYARLLANEKPLSVISEDESFNKNKNSQNLLIKGDNLEVLKHLKNAYYKSIKMIYIDPPYNTGSDFIYKDDRKFSADELSQKAGIELGEAKRILEFTQKGSNSHSAWLTFIYPRLYIARHLLRDDGVIFISIDDNEQAQLKLLCDEIFGEENFVSCFIWQKKSGGGRSTYFYEGHEYVLIYTKNISYFNGLYKIVKQENKNEVNKDFLRKVYGKYTNNSTIQHMLEKYPDKIINHRNLMFEELEIWLKEGLMTQETYDNVKNNLKNGTYFLKPYNQNFNLVCKNDIKDISLMYSIIQGFWTSDGNNENEAMFGKNIFKDPKPINFLRLLINSISYGGGGKRANCVSIAKQSEAEFGKTRERTDMSVTADEPNSNKAMQSEITQGDIILDFFAGSGTTAHAVMEQNLADNGNRKFILVQLDEPINQKSNKTAYDYVKNELKVKNPTIFDITKERIIRAKAKLISENSDKDLSNYDMDFKIFKISKKEQFIEDIENFSQQKLPLFSKYDNNTTLTTFKLYDGIGLEKNLTDIKLKDYIAKYDNENKLYLINENFTSDDLNELIKRLDDDKNFKPNTIIINAINFSSVMQREISENLTTILNAKSIDIKIIIRHI